MDKPIVFSTPQYEYLKDILVKNNPWESGIIKRKVFKNQETHRIVESDVQRKDIIFIAGTNESDLLELFFVSRAIEKFQAKSIHIVIPFFNYSTQERATVKGEVVTAKGISALISAIPIASQGNFTYMLDLHSEGIVHYFEGFCKSINLKANDILYPILKSLNCSVIASPDAGRSKTIEKMAEDLNLEPALTLKRRTANNTHITNINADVKDKDIIIYDDMIRSGGTILNAVKTYKDKGANKIYIATSHGDFCDDGLNKLLNNKDITKVICSNSKPTSLVNHPKYQVYSIDAILSEPINNNLGIKK